jgi:hypothetical protein
VKPGSVQLACHFSKALSTSIVSMYQEPVKLLHWFTTVTSSSEMDALLS